jgi:hypothetical protein
MILPSVLRRSVTLQIPPQTDPLPGFADPDGDGPDIPAFSADQMKEYARAAIQKERGRCAKIAHAELPSVTAERVAAAIRRGE